jgi:uncharacterized protein YbbC (DUF1343 family)/CubicO group peptidase (beta-lactamase class C family)
MSFKIVTALPIANRRSGGELKTVAEIKQNEESGRRVIDSISPCNFSFPKLASYQSAHSNDTSGMNNFSRALALPPCLTLFLASHVFSSEPNTGFRPEKLTAIDQAINKAVAEQSCPGGVLWFEHRSSAYHKAYGHRSLVPGIEPMTEDTIFDAASLTKVIAVTPAIMLLVEQGKVELDKSVQQYINEFTGEGRESITVRHLLTHTSGLRPGIETRSGWLGREEAFLRICDEKPQTAPGTVFRYSDIEFLLLGEIIQRVSNAPLDEFVARTLFQPLKMVDTGYLPPATKLDRIAPTEVVNGDPWRGVVHDPTARRMGGVAGHAGLFTTARDLARFSRMLLNLGELDGTRVFKANTVKLMTSVQTPSSVHERRGLGWDIDSAYSGPRGKHFPLGSYGHTGWTGTSLWIDPFSQSFLIFLSNRNHPTEKGSVSDLRRQLGTLSAEAIADFNFAGVPGALAPRSSAEEEISKYKPKFSGKVLIGIDVLVKSNFAPLKGKRLGLVTNQTGQSRDRTATIDLLLHAPDVTLKVLFSPEHGIRGTIDQAVGDSTDERTGLPIFSLYGKTNKPSPEQLKELDALVFDIQDVGCRFYTYISTMGLCLEAAAAAGLKIFVLDRVNPINGVTLDGPVLTEQTSFVGFHTLPLRFGMTMGELAKMFNSERGYKADLTVIPLEGWSREMWFDDTGLPWCNPSPNMRSLTAASLYPGIGLLETALSVGRGTDTPFELIGAPFIEDVRFADQLNKAALPGVRFIPIQFTPRLSVHKDQLCHGVSILVTAREFCRPVDIAVVAAKILHEWYPKQFEIEKMAHLLLHSRTLEAIKAGKSLNEIHILWKPERDDFLSRRQQYLLYK